MTNYLPLITLALWATSYIIHYSALDGFWMILTVSLIYAGFGLIIFDLGRENDRPK